MHFSQKTKHWFTYKNTNDCAVTSNGNGRKMSCFMHDLLVDVLNRVLDVRIWDKLI